MVEIGDEEAATQVVLRRIATHPRALLTVSTVFSRVARIRMAYSRRGLHD
jgi:hypothetical protein